MEFNNHPEPIAIVGMGKLLHWNFHEQHLTVYSMSIAGGSRVTI